MVRIHLHPQGTRVRVRRGRYPIDPSLEGREGTVLILDRTKMARYQVQLDGERSLRSFDESELEKISSPASIEDTGSYRGGGASDASS